METEGYKGYTITIEHDQDMESPFEDACYPEGMGLVTKPQTYLDGGISADDFYMMVGDFDCFVGEQYNYDVVTRQANNKKYYTYDDLDMATARVAVAAGGFATEEESLEWFARTNEIPVESDYYWLPVYRYEHGGVAYNTTGFSCPWDSGQAGYIYIKKSVAESEGWKTAVAAYDYMRAVVETLSMWANGECYGFIITKPNVCECCEHDEPEEVESGWGFLGYDYCLESAKEAVNYLVEEANDEAAAKDDGGDDGD